METIAEPLFMLNIAFLAIAHELDAIQQHEWRFFFAYIPVSDETAYRIFTALHVPLFVWIGLNWQVEAFQIGFDLFMVAHAAVHWLLRHHPLITFDSWFSRLWIFGGAFLGIIHLGVIFVG